MSQPKGDFGLGRNHAGPVSQSSGLPPPIDTRRPLPKIEGQETSPTTAGPSHHQAAQRREMLKAKRRVPAAQRKRTKLSCDYCKTRRCKCQRLDHATPADDGGQAGGGEEGLAPCKLCVEAGIPCVTTMPRKHRIYGSVESLDRRYRALDALVHGLHPQLGPEATAEELAAFGREMGVEMPDVTPESHDGKQSFDNARPRSISASTLISPVSPEHRASRSEPSDDSASLVRDTNGRPHYIGPSGSLAFFSKLRSLVANRANATGARDGGQPQTIASDFLGEPIMGSIYGHMDTERSTFVIPGAAAHQAHFRGDSPTAKMADAGDWHNNSPDHLRHCIPAHKVKLPTREESDSYVEAFFCQVHPNFLIFHRPTFQSVYEEIWRTAGTPSDKHGTHVSVGWLCCLYMIYVLGSRSMPQNQQSLDFQRSYYAEANELPPLLVNMSLPNVCALMLLSLYSNHTNDRTNAWTFHGIACRLAVALGMHRQDVSAAFHPITRELRKRVWWTLYAYEQSLCCALGRPTAIDDREVDVDYPDENVLVCAYGQPARLVEQSSRLWHLVGCIRRDVCDPAYCPASRYSQALQYLRRLLSWRAHLPPDMMPTAAGQRRTDGTWRAMMLMHVTYQCALGLLTRRFLLKEVETSEQGQELGTDAYLVTQLGKVCVTSALRCVSLLVELWRGQCFNGVSWLDVYWAYLASMEITLRLVAPNSLPPRAGSPRGARQAWKFEPHEPQPPGGPAAPPHRPQTELDHELETLLAQNQLVERHSIADMTDAVRQVHDILKTVEMSGTNARFAKIATEFAKAMGLVDGKPTSTLFGGRMGAGLDTVRAHESHAAMQTMGHAPPPPPPSAGPSSAASLLHGHHPPPHHHPMGSAPPHPQDFGAGAEAAAAAAGWSSPARAPAPPPFHQSDSGLPYTSGAEGVYSGVYNPTAGGAAADLPSAAAAVTQAPDIQWDMVLAPEQWDQNEDLLTDMTGVMPSGWATWPLAPNNNSPYPYPPMGPA